MQHGNRALPVFALLFVILGGILASVGYGTAAWSVLSAEQSAFGQRVAKLEVQLGPIMTCGSGSALGYSDQKDCKT
jgi:hypothetical protein